jgi:hypothetical protein
MIPYSITVGSAAAPDASLRFLFYGGIAVLPVIAIYTIGVYWVFRGKVRASPASELRLPGPGLVSPADTGPTVRPPGPA